MSLDQQVPVITVDGPSGSGKGTVCRILAERYGYALLDSGAIYRLAALAALQQNMDFSNEEGLACMAELLDIEFKLGPTETVVLLNAMDVSLDIRAEQTGMAASKIAALPKVREALLTRQRDFAKAPGLVADGRDMGTVVFPNAAHKFFLTASSEERARRRVLQLEQAGSEAQYERILNDIRERDERDMNRASAPLKPAEDAILIDSSGLNIQQVIDEIEKHL